MGVNDTDGSIKKQVILDGVRYDITVKPFSGAMFQANWHCSTCKEDGPWAPISGDKEQAVESAVAGLEVHHALLHGRAKVTRHRPRSNIMRLPPPLVGWWRCLDLSLYSATA